MHEGVLPTGVADVATTLAEWPALRSFYLSGGTALALQHGHRQSRDLDFFTKSPLSTLPALSGLNTLLDRFTHVAWIQRDPDQFHLQLNGVSVTLLAYPFSHDFDFRSWNGSDVADVRDIAVQKAHTIGRRAHARDYLDLHEILTTGVVTLGNLMQRAQHTYQGAFSPRLFLQQLTYTRDLPDRDDALSLLTVPRAFEAIEQDLQMIVRQWVQEMAQVPHSPRTRRSRP